MFLYKIENKINGKVYAGITSNIKRRWKEHRNTLKNNKHHNKHLQGAWNKYGTESFSFDVINKFNNLEDMNKAEVEYIKNNNLLNSNAGYNINHGGDAFNHTDQAKKAISLSQEKSVISKCLKTGVETVYNSVSDTKEDGFNPKCIASACNLTIYSRSGKSFQSKTHKKHVWMYLSDYSKKPQELTRRFVEFKNTKARKSTYKPVYGMCIKTKEIRYYEAIDHAAKDGFDHKTVRKCLKQDSPNKTCNGWVWAKDKNELEGKRHNRTKHDKAE